MKSSFLHRCRLYTTFTMCMREKTHKNVIVISKQIIRPSFPTPDHLHTLQLSFLDQLASQIYIPRIFFYPHHQGYNHDNLKNLKNSLCYTLTKFYPLAGRLNANSYIHCTDEGVHYFEARVDCKISEVVEEDHPSKLNKFLPYKLNNAGDHPLLAIQVNVFQCGGIAIGVCISHKIADAYSLAMFIKHWAANTHGSADDCMVKPNFELAKHFPPKDMSIFKPANGAIKENLRARRFAINAPMIEEIRAKHANGNSSKPPTRIEALSAFVWDRFIAANGLQEQLDQEEVYTLVQVVNMRKRIPSMKLDACFGNISLPATITPSTLLNAKNDSNNIVKNMRDAIEAVNFDYAMRINNDNEHSNVLLQFHENVAKGCLTPFVFSSLCRTPLYDADFGWGKPIWVTSAALTFKNLAVFTDSRCGEGIEVWLNLKETDMVRLAAHQEFLKFLSPTTIP